MNIDTIFTRPYTVCMESISTFRPMDHLQKRAPLWLPVFLFFFASLCIRLFVLFQSEFAYGADGYYYAAQIRYLFTKGYFFSPDSSPLLYLMAGMARITGDIVVGNKILIALLGAALVFPAFLLGRGEKRNPAGGLVAAAIMTGSTLAAHFTFDYVKNLAGILVFLFFLNSVNALREGPWRLHRAVEAVLLFLLLFFTHKLMAGLGLFAAAVFLLYRVRSRWKMLLLPGILAAGVVFVLGRVMPGLLTLADFSRLSGLFSAVPQAAPFSFMGLYPASPLLFVESILFMVLPPVIFIVLFRRKSAGIFHWFLFLLWLLAVNPFFRFTGDNLAFRFYLLVFIPAALLIPEIVPSFRRKWTLALLLAGMLVWQTAALERVRRLPGHDYQLYRDLLPLLRLPENHLLIMHLGFDYFYCYNGKGDAFHFLPEKKHDTRPVFRLSHGVSKELMKKHRLDSREIMYLPGGYTLMREGVWNKLLAGVDRKTKARLLTWRNPHRYRPGYMRQADRFLKE